MLRHPMVGGVYQMRRHGITEPVHRIAPGREQNPLAESRHVLNQYHRLPVVLRTRHNRPSCRSRCVVMWSILAPGRAVPLARWRSQQKVLRGNRTPVSLLQILADVVCVGMVELVNVHGCPPVVGGPDHGEARRACTLREPAGTGEKISALHTTSVEDEPELNTRHASDGIRKSAFQLAHVGGLSL
jgi:hypothetical protein